MGAVLKFRPSDEPPGWMGGPADNDDDLAKADEELPVRLELVDPQSGEVIRTLALLAGVEVGFGAYYAALATYPAHHVRLRSAARVLIQTPGTH